LTGARWLPAECDFMMRDSNWFYQDSDTHTVKSAEELLGIYYYSVGRGSNMLLNIGPDRRGLLPDADKASLLGLGKEVQRRFSDPVEAGHAWEQVGNTWTCSLGGWHLLDHIVLQEDLTSGESARRFRISIETYKTGKNIVVYEGQNIGHKAICQFPLVRTPKITIEILDSDGDPDLKSIHAYNSTNARLPVK